ncbi:ABC transporter substrate-binding protein [Halorussus amylolyticus]|uniref:ABC transporter substrate-binding protein n=1 Tax=Halorussus amylolyticus TaxID=1126242 RepID=UPI0010479B16|nr:ABC transporter substrate-binding protein [Halorussus amylolyticus]
MRDTDDSSDLSRRGVLLAGASVTATALAGCTGGESDDQTTEAGGSDPTTEATTATESEETTEAETEEDETEGQSSYTVSMAPVGDVTFDAVPETWEAYFPGYADMGVALGQADGLSAVGQKARYYTSYYDELDGVSVDKDALVDLVGDSGIDKEIYYEVDNDVHLTDPEWLVSNDAFGLDADDIEEVENAVGPFVGNSIFRRTDEWHDYRFYTMYEAFEKVAQVFRKEDQYDAFASFHDDFVAEIQADLPSADARPNGLLCFAASDEPEEFSPYRLTDKGANKKHFRDLGISDALSGTGVEGLSESNRGQIDYETMLEVDPDTLFVRGHETKTRAEFEDTVLAFMQGHNVASQLTAVENEDVYRGGPIYQGPIQNLFLTERFATLLYPDAYSGELFDRDELAAIVTGDF